MGMEIANGLLARAFSKPITCSYCEARAVYEGVNQHGTRDEYLYCEGHVSKSHTFVEAISEGKE